jgi:hypothetical protein
VGNVGVGFAESEVRAVRERYPGLHQVDGYTLEGSFDLNASFEEVVIVDAFSIRLVALPDYPESLPLMSEVGGRTDAIAAKYCIKDLRQLHRNPNGTACLCVKQMERRKVPRESDLNLFIEELVVPYLYGLSYFDNNGLWRWGEHSHGALGLLEFYAEGDTNSSIDELRVVGLTMRLEKNWKEFYKQIKRPSADRHCVCGSQRPFSKCHRRAWLGTTNLISELRRAGLQHFG